MQIADPAIHYVGDARAVGSGFTFPGDGGPRENTYGYVGPNFLFTAVPEPSTWALLAVAVLTFLALRVRIRRPTHSG